MSEFTNLYILVFPDRSIIKIGKANEILDRIQALKRSWGEVDYEASYSLSASPEIVFRLENTLHFLLSPYAVTFAHGDGHTELFSMDALDLALKHIELFCSSGAVAATLKRSISRPGPSVRPRQNRKRGKHVVFRRKIMAQTTSAKAVAEKFERINRLLIILLRRQTRIAYQYDIIDGTVYFRLRLPKNLIEAKTYPSALLVNFNFIIEDLHTNCGINCCRGVGVDGVFQYQIGLSHKSGEPYHPLLSYFFAQSESLLKQLPQRSSAALAEIPLLDEFEVLNSISGYEEEGLIRTPKLTLSME